MAKDSLEAWKIWKQAQQKYDYFIVGLTTALLAYLGGSFSPEPFAFSQNTFELISLTFLLASVVTGILKLESDLSVQSTNLRKVEAQEQLDVVNKILNFPSRSIDLDTGMEISLTEAKERQNILQEFISKAGKGLNKVGKKSERLFITRNIFLLLGLLCLIISKFISLCVVYQNV
ncbi:MULTISPECIES: hypothetical protein [unclassified Methylophaga]|uniref:hypothetical protein n=1 Tax=unclassified Methylophaga TaxID=2629249 RepID=UPI000C93FE72|nr:MULTISPECIES: hypothetical protein [unclassified Methylophaga]MBN46755.1 hypothetical protein [Methylophaga sp.]|tara:strand:+ start:63026 stop:63550 length:525 start_codon:yes stop_codon:yes gene_type:complete